jgi:excisionase family DNA binding protein
LNLDVPSLDEIRAAVREELAAALAGRPSPWLELTAAADYLGCTTTALRSMVQRRQVAAHKSETGRLRFRREDLDAHARGEPRAW